MACVFLRLVCTRVLAYTWQLSPSSTIIFGSGYDSYSALFRDRTPVVVKGSYGLGDALEFGL
jgi:hypothetical protein